MTKKTEANSKIDCFDFLGRSRQASGHFLWGTFWNACLAILLFLSAFVFCPAIVKAQEEIPQSEMLSKSVNGEIGAKTGQGFALVYKADNVKEYEIWFPFRQNVQYIGGYNAAEDMEFKDKVLVTYDETKDGKARFLKSVNLIRKAEPVAAKAASDAQTDSGDEEEEAEQN